MLPGAGFEPVDQPLGSRGVGAVAAVTAVAKAPPEGRARRVRAPPSVEKAECGETAFIWWSEFLRTWIAI